MKLSKDAKERIIISLTSETVGNEVIEAIERGTENGLSQSEVEALIAVETENRENADDEIFEILLFKEDQIVYVTKNGNDIEADGSKNKPFQTITSAFNSITDASPSKRYVVRLAPGNYSETIILPANVFVIGDGVQTTRITGAVSMASSFSGSGDHRSGFSRVALLSACDFNWQTVTSAAGKLYFSEVLFNSTLNMYGHNNAIAQASFGSCFLFGAFTVSGINVGIFTNNVCFSNITLNQHPNGGMATLLVATGGYCGGTITQTTTVNNFGRRCASFLRNFWSENLIVNGPSSYADVDLVSGSKQGAQQLNGGQVIALNPIISHDLTTQMIVPRNTNSHNMGDWGKQWTWNFGYVHASTGTDLFIISYPASYAPDSAGKSIGIYTDGAGLQENVNGGSIYLGTASTSGTGIQGEINLSSRVVNFTKTPSTNFVIENGLTADRPASPVSGQMFFDKSINKPIWHNGTNWVDSTGTIV